MLHRHLLITLVCLFCLPELNAQDFSSLPFSGVLQVTSFRPDSVYKGNSRQALPFRYMNGLRDNISVLGRQENLDINQVMSLCMDSRHNLWIGGYNGEIGRFDGYRIHYYHLAPLFANPIEDIMEDSQGNIWFGSRAGGFVRFNGHSFDYFGPQSGCSFKVFSFYEDKQGAVWVCTNGDGLIGINENQYKQIGIAEGLKDGAVTCLTEDMQGSYWTGYFKRGIQGTAGPVSGLADSTVFALLPTPYGLLTGTRQGLYFLPRGEQQCRQIIADTGFLDLIPLPDGTVLCASNGGGIYRVAIDENTEWKVIDVTATQDGLSSNRITNLVADQEGNIWAGTYDAGLNLIRPQLFTNLNESSGLNGDRHWSLLSQGNRILAGYNTQGVAELSVEADGQIRIDHPARKGLTSGVTVTEMFSSPDGTIWFSAGREGVIAERNGKPKRYPFAANRGTQGVKAMSSDATGRIIFGTWSGLMFLDRDSIRPIPFESGLVLNNINDLKTDEYGNIWIASDAGLMCMPYAADSMAQPRCIRFGERISRKGLSVQSVLPVGELIWIGTDGDGIIRINGNQALSAGENSAIEKVVVGSAQGLGDLFIMALHFDGQHLWAGSKKGIFKLLSSPGQGQDWKWRSYGITEGLLDNDIMFNNTTTDALGRIWWCTNGGLSLYHPDRERPDTIAPLVSLDGLNILFESINWFTRGETSGDPRLQASPSYLKSLLSEYIYYDQVSPWNWLPVDPVFSHDQNHLTFHFSGRDWYNPVGLRYAVRMAGSDQEWIDLGEVTSITYNSLSPGEYTFQVKAISADGTESEVVGYTFCIMPPYWQTSWFIAMVVGLSLLILYLIYRWRVKKLERERDILELKVEERTEELKKEKNKSEQLLLNILPRDTVNELKETGRSEARMYRQATVLFSDFSGFTDMTTRIQPAELIESLDAFFNAFDDIADKYGVEKIKTIGDSYMAACGIPIAREDHALRMAGFALEVLDATERINQQRVAGGKSPWPIRIGLHSGPLLAGVVGTKKFAYDIWGDTVNTASRMEGNGEPGRINISLETAMLLKDQFYIAPRGKMMVKGKGEMEMFWLESFKVPFREEGNKRKPNQEFMAILLSPLPNTGGNDIRTDRL